jgi:hypothetical protein
MIRGRAGAHIENSLIDELAAGEGPVEGLLRAMPGEKVGRTDVRILGDAVQTLGGYAEGGGVPQLANDEHDDFVFIKIIKKPRRAS